MGICLACLGLNFQPEQFPGSAGRNNDVVENLPMTDCALPVQYSLGQTYANPIPRDASSDHRYSVSPVSNGGTLEKIAIPLYSPVSITREKLTKKRLEFWETAPAYGGSLEVWQALRNAVEVGNADIGTGGHRTDVRFRDCLRKGVRGLAMILFTGLVTTLLFIYLLAALLRPEWF